MFTILPLRKANYYKDLEIIRILVFEKHLWRVESKEPIDARVNHALTLTRCDFPGGLQTDFAPIPGVVPLLPPKSRWVIFQFGFGA